MDKLEKIKRDIIENIINDDVKNIFNQESDVRLADLETIETLQLGTMGDYVLWVTPYKDHLDWWVSDLEGCELLSFTTKKQAIKWIKQENNKKGGKLK